MSHSIEIYSLPLFLKSLINMIFYFPRLSQLISISIQVLLLILSCSFTFLVSCFISSCSILILASIRPNLLIIMSISIWLQWKLGKLSLKLLNRSHFLGTMLWKVVRDFITFFSVIKLWYENNTFFALIKLLFRAYETFY